MRRRAAALSVVPYAQERTDAHKNIALSYALFKFANFVMPYYASFWNDTLHNLGLEVDNSNVDPTSPVGVGNLAGPPALLAGSAVGCFSNLARAACPRSRKGASAAHWPCPVACVQSCNALCAARWWLWSGSAWALQVCSSMRPHFQAMCRPRSVGLAVLPLHGCLLRQHWA